MHRSVMDRLISATGAVLAVLLLVGGILALVGHNFVTNQVTSQLKQEQIYFPAAGSAGLSASEFPGLQQYGGQMVDTGPKAKAYADEYIWHHMMTASGNKSYAQISSEARANPNDAKLAALKTTLFQGDMLRSSLLSAYAFWQFGVIALWVAIVAFVGAAVLAFLAVLGFRHAGKVEASLGSTRYAEPANA